MGAENNAAANFKTIENQFAAKKVVQKWQNT